MGRGDRYLVPPRFTNSQKVVEPINKLLNKKRVPFIDAIGGHTGDSFFIRQDLIIA